MELNIPFSVGQNNSLPAVSDSPGFFVTLQNISPQNSQLLGLDARLQTHTIASPVTNLNFTFDATSRFSDIYAFADNGIYRIYAAGTTLIASDTTTTNRWSSTQWANQIYFTRPGSLLRKVQGSAATNIPIITSVEAESNQTVLNLSARYTLAAHDHLWLGNITQDGTLRSNTVRWSDLYNPEEWEISETSESDEFSLSVNDLEITGLLMHRNQVLIFSSNSIWVAKYEGLPSVYGFEPLYARIGCGYHHSAVNVGEECYFISTEGVYRMNSFQLSKISDPIWDRLRVDIQTLSEIPGVVDGKKGLIYWRVGTKTYVYNYEENRWAVYDFLFANALLYIPGTLSRTAVIDSVSGMIDSYATMIDAGINTLSITQTQYLSSTSNVYQEEVGTVENRNVTVETPYFFVDSIWFEKELRQIRLAHTTVGSVAITCTVSMKDSMNGAVRTETSTILTDANFVNESLFHTRNVKVGKLISLKLTYSNTSTNYVSALMGFSLDIYNGKSTK